MAAAVHAVDPLLPVPMAKTMDDIVAQSVAQPRFQMTLVLFFAAVAALLASLGIYGVIAYAVAQRTSELGIRTALGASPQAILLMVVAQGLRPVAIGLAVGLGLSFVVGRAVSSLLYDVSTYDPLTLVGVVVAIGLVSLVAALGPARRATQLNPVAALRQE